MSYEFSSYFYVLTAYQGTTRKVITRNDYDQIFIIAFPLEELQRYHDSLDDISKFDRSRVKSTRNSSCVTKRFVHEILLTSNDTAIIFSTRSRVVESNNDNKRNKHLDVSGKKHFDRTVSFINIFKGNIRKDRWRPTIFHKKISST